jgi:hypothetical protein
MLNGMKLRKLWRNKPKVNKVIFYNFDFNFLELNEIIQHHYKKYSNVLYKSGNKIAFVLKFSIIKTEYKDISDNFEIYFDYLDFKNYSKFKVYSAKKSTVNQFAIINLKFDYLSFYNGVLGLLDEYHQQFCNHNYAPLFLIDVKVSDEILIQLKKLNSLQLTDNQLFHSIVFSPSVSSENIVQQDKSLYKIISDLRFFLSFRTKQYKQQALVCGTLLYFTLNQQLNMQNFIYYCNKHINSKSSLRHG